MKLNKYIDIRRLKNVIVDTNKGKKIKLLLLDCGYLFFLIIKRKMRMVQKNIVELSEVIKNLEKL